MCKELKKKSSKYGPHMSACVLFICFIFLCVVTSSTDDGLIWIDGKVWGYDQEFNVGWQSNYGWSSDNCISNGSVLGALSIISESISLITVGMLVYFRIIKKNKNKIFGVLYQRHSILIICMIIFIFLIPSSAAYWSSCNHAIWEAHDTDDYNFKDWGPDIGLILLCIACFILLIIIVLLSIFPWVEEINNKSQNQIDKNKNVPIEEQQMAISDEQQSLTLPDGWVAAYTKDGKIYYQDTIHKTTQWEHPCLQNIRKESNFENMSDAKILELHKLITPFQNQQQDDASTLPLGWIKAYTDDGTVYYKNTIQKTTQWEHPCKQNV